MKKLVVVLALIMIFSSFMAHAEEIDLTAMTTDELIALRNSINAEIHERVDNGSDEIVTNGRYIVGENIKAGIYKLRCVEINSSAGKVTIMVRPLDTDSDPDRKYTADWHLRCKEEECTVTLQDGFSMSINGGTCAIETVTSSFVP